MTKREGHEVTILPGPHASGLYSAECSCGYRMFNTTRDLIERHTQDDAPAQTHLDRIAEQRRT